MLYPPWLIMNSRNQRDPHRSCLLGKLNALSRNTGRFLCWNWPKFLTWFRWCRWTWQERRCLLFLWSNVSRHPFLILTCHNGRLCWHCFGKKIGHPLPSGIVLFLKTSKERPLGTWNKSLTTDHRDMRQNESRVLAVLVFLVLEHCLPVLPRVLRKSIMLMLPPNVRCFF